MAQLPENDRLRGPFVAEAGQTDFPSDYPLIKAEGLRIRRVRGDDVEILSGASVSALDISESDFTARLASPCEAGDVVWLYSELPTSRDRAHPPGGAVRTATLEGDAVEFAALFQEARRDLEMSVRVPPGETPPGPDEISKAAAAGPVAASALALATAAAFDAAYAEAMADNAALDAAQALAEVTGKADQVALDATDAKADQAISDAAYAEALADNAAFDAAAALAGVDGKADVGEVVYLAGTFQGLGGVTVPAGIKRIVTTAFAVGGAVLAIASAAPYVEDPAVDAAYVTAHPRAAKLDAAGRGFRLDAAVPTPEMLGAVGDGTANDAAALNAAANWAASRGLELECPGVYRANSDITVTDLSLVMRGTGAVASKIILGPNCQILYDGGTPTEYDSPRVILRDLTIHTSNQSTKAAVRIQFDTFSGGTATGAVIENCEISGQNGLCGFTYAVDCWNVGNVRAVGNRILGDRDNQVGFLVSSLAGFHIDGDGDPTEFKASDNNITFVQHAYLIGGEVEGVYISGSTVVACNYGIKDMRTSSGEPLLIVNDNHFNTYSYGVRCQNRAQSFVHHNLFYGFGGNYVGVEVTSDSGLNAAFIVESNIFEQFSTASSNGVFVQGNLGVDNVRISGNKFTAFQTGISLGVSSNGVRVTADNEFLACTSKVIDSGAMNFIEYAPVLDATQTQAIFDKDVTLGVNQRFVFLPSGVVWAAGTGSPEGVYPAVVGSLYSQTNAAAGYQLWSKRSYSGDGKSGWALCGGSHFDRAIQALNGLIFPNNKALSGTSAAGSVHVIANYAGDNLQIGDPTSSGSILLARDAVALVDTVGAIGTASRRVNSGYAFTSWFATSDARQKTPVRPLTPAELACSRELVREIGLYKMLEAIERKGEANARLHCSMTVQRAIEIFESHGLLPFAYSFIGLDSWELHEEQPSREVWGTDEETGEDVLIETIPAVMRPAGDVYSFRETGLLFFLMRGQAEEVSDIKARLDLAGL